MSSPIADVPVDLDAAMPRRPPLSLPDRLRRDAGAFVTDSFFSSLGHAVRYLPVLHPRFHGLELLRDMPYVADGSWDHVVDIYRPQKRTGGPLPVILYFHGGGFRFLSKESHRLFALAFARRGYCVVSANYRRAPRNPFPAAHADACAAYVWTVKNIAAYGGDPTRIAIAGDSAGANLAASIPVAACTPRPEPWARAVFDTGVVPKAVLPACGILQVSNPERFLTRPGLSRFIYDRLAEVGDAYLGPVLPKPARELEMADPLCIIERTKVWDRPLPPFFVQAGTADPLEEDNKRLEAALSRQGVVCEAHYYPGQMHVFHSFVFTSAARDSWRKTYAFLDRYLPVRVSA
jgi:acetyl esterase